MQQFSLIRATWLGYVYRQRLATAEKKILAKQAFEQFTANCGIMQIKAYHADKAYSGPTNGFKSAAPTTNP